MPAPSLKNGLATEVLEELEQSKADAVSYSFFDATFGFRETLIQDLAQSKVVYTRELSKYDALRLPVTPRPFLVSLPSIFRKAFLVRILGSFRPFVRKYSPRSPAEVEKRVGKTFLSVWFCPMTVGVFVEEFGICIDDDNSAGASSAISRNLYSAPPDERPKDHKGAYSAGPFVGYFLDSKATVTGRVVASLAFRLDTAVFSLQALYFRLVDRTGERKPKTDPHC